MRRADLSVSAELLVNNHETRTTCITVNRCGHLYTEIPYSKYIEYKSVVTQSQSHTSADHPTSFQ